VVKLVHDCVMFLGPFLLELLLKHLQGQGSGERMCAALGTHGPGCALAAASRAQAHPPCCPSAPFMSVAALGGLGLACGLAAASVVETLTVNAYFHMLFRICLHLKVGWLAARSAVQSKKCG